MVGLNCHKWKFYLVNPVLLNSIFPTKSLWIVCWIEGKLKPKQKSRNVVCTLLLLLSHLYCVLNYTSFQEAHVQDHHKHLPFCDSCFSVFPSYSNPTAACKTLKHAKTIRKKEYFLWQEIVGPVRYYMFIVLPQPTCRSWKSTTKLAIGLSWKATEFKCIFFGDCYMQITNSIVHI